MLTYSSSWTKISVRCDITSSRICTCFPPEPELIYKLLFFLGSPFQCQNFTYITIVGTLIPLLRLWLPLCLRSHLTILSEVPAMWRRGPRSSTHRPSSSNENHQTVHKLKSLAISCCHSFNTPQQSLSEPLSLMVCPTNFNCTLLMRFMILLSILALLNVSSFVTQAVQGTSSINLRNHISAAYTLFFMFWYIIHASHPYMKSDHTKHFNNLFLVCMLIHTSPNIFTFPKASFGVVLLSFISFSHLDTLKLYFLSN